MALLPESGHVRLVSRVMESWRRRSIQSEVPVYPRWPKEPAEKYFPDCDGEEGVSHPRAREVPAGAVSRLVKRATVSGRRIWPPPWSKEWAKIATSAAEAKRPA